MRYAIAYLTTALMFGAVDACWITFAGPKVYRPLIGDILADTISVGPAVAFYLLYIGGIVVLAIAPALKDGGWGRAMTSGAVLGLVAYGTYDLTNQATLKVWATKITLLDMTYGALATGLAAVVGYHAASWLARSLAH